ncbi:vesicle coat component [Terramyces sp. JEL0728]|nr:vesicle coat component [Terramyces sp. JEL0728]
MRKFQFSGIPPRKKRSESNFELKKNVEQTVTTKKPIQTETNTGFQVKPNDWGFDDEIDWGQVNNAEITAETNGRNDPTFDNVQSTNKTGFKSFEKDPVANINSAKSTPVPISSAQFKDTTSSIKKISPQQTVLSVTKSISTGVSQPDEVITKKIPTPRLSPKKVVMVTSEPLVDDASWDKDNKWGDWNSPEIPPVLDLPIKQHAPPTVTKSSPPKANLKSPLNESAMKSSTAKSPSFGKASPISNPVVVPSLAQAGNNISQDTASWDIGDEDLFTQNVGESIDKTSAGRPSPAASLLKSPAANAVQPSPKPKPTTQMEQLPYKSPTINNIQPSPKIVQPFTEKSPNRGTPLQIVETASLQYLPVTSSPKPAISALPAPQKSPAVRAASPNKRSPAINKSPKLQQKSESPQLAFDQVPGKNKSKEMMLTSAPGFLAAQPENNPPRTTNSFQTSPVIPSKSPEVPFRKQSTAFQDQPGNLQYFPSEPATTFEQNGQHDTVGYFVQDPTQINHGQQGNALYDEYGYPIQPDTLGNNAQYDERDHTRILNSTSEQDWYAQQASYNTEIGDQNLGNYGLGLKLQNQTVDPNYQPMNQEASMQQAVQEQHHIQQQYISQHYQPEMAQFHGNTETLESKFADSQQNISEGQYNYSSDGGQQVYGTHVPVSIPSYSYEAQNNTQEYSADHNNQQYLQETSQFHPNDLSQSIPQESGKDQGGLHTDYPGHIQQESVVEQSNQKDYPAEQQYYQDYPADQQDSLNYPIDQQYQTNILAEQQHHQNYPGQHNYDQEYTAEQYYEQGIPPEQHDHAEFKGGLLQPQELQAEQYQQEYDQNYYNTFSQHNDASAMVQAQNNQAHFTQGEYIPDGNYAEVVQKQADAQPQPTQWNQNPLESHIPDTFSGEVAGDEYYPQDEFGLQQHGAQEEDHLQSNRNVLPEQGSNLNNGNSTGIPQEEPVGTVDLHQKSKVPIENEQLESQTQKIATIELSQEIDVAKFEIPPSLCSEIKVMEGQITVHSVLSADTLGSRRESFHAESVIAAYNTCHLCDKNNDTDANFCAKCGTKLITKDPLFRDRGHGFGAISEYGQLFSIKVNREHAEKATAGNLLWHSIHCLTATSELTLTKDIFKTNGPIFDFAQANLESLIHNISNYIELLTEEDTYLIIYYLLLMLQYNDTDLLCADFEQAIRLAVNSCLWEIALIVSKYCNSDSYGKVILAMVKGGIGNSILPHIEPAQSSLVMELVLAVMGNADVQDIRELLSLQNEKFISNWKLYLAALLAIRGENSHTYLHVLGEMLCETGLFKVAHLCELISFSFNLKDGLQRFKANVTLLGADHITYPNTFHNDFVALQLTELLEAHIILNRQWQNTPFISLQQYKLKYASFLGDIGYSDQASRYLDSITSFTQYLAPDEDEDTDLFTSSLIRFKSNYLKLDADQPIIPEANQYHYGDQYGETQTKGVDFVNEEYNDQSIEDPVQTKPQESHVYDGYDENIQEQHQNYDENQRYFANQEYEYGKPVGDTGNPENYNYEEASQNYGGTMNQPIYGHVENTGFDNGEVASSGQAYNADQQYYNDQYGKPSPPLPPTAPGIPKSHLSPPISKMEPKLSPPPTFVRAPVKTDEDEDLGFGNSKPIPKAPTAAEVKKEDPKEEVKKEGKQYLNPVVKKTSTSFLSRIFSPFSSKKTEEQPTVYKAHLPTGNPIVYDPVTKKWVKKDQLGKTETKQDSGTPPPPILPPSTAASEVSGPPSVKASDSPISTPTGITPPISRSSTKKRGARSKYVDIINPNSADSSPVVQSFVPQFDSPIGEPKIMSPKNSTAGPKMMDIASLSNSSREQTVNTAAKTQPARVVSPLVPNLPQTRTAERAPVQPPPAANTNRLVTANQNSPAPNIPSPASRPPSANLHGRSAVNPGVQRTPSRTPSQYPSDINPPQILSRPSSTNSMGNFDKPARQGAPPADL